MKIVFVIFKLKAGYDIFDLSAQLQAVLDQVTNTPKAFDTYEAAEIWLKDNSSIDTAYTILKLYCQP